MTEKSFFAGFGGQGIISLGQIWVFCAMKEGKNVTCFPFYGAEKRGGIARAGVIISDEEIASPIAAVHDSVLVMNQDSLALCESSLKAGGLMLINSTMVKEEPGRKDINVRKIDATSIAEKAGGVLYSSMVAMGALAKLTGAIHIENIESVLMEYFPKDKQKFVKMNVEAIRSGFREI